jgi:hypothetical protein
MQYPLRVTEPSEKCLNEPIIIKRCTDFSKVMLLADLQTCGIFTSLFRHTQSKLSGEYGMKNISILTGIAVCTLILLSLAACESESPTAGASIIPSPTPLPRPLSGKATVTGRVVSLSNQPVPQVAVWLAEVIRQGDQGVFVLDSRSSLGAYTDERGVFVIPNVSPGEYVIVVGDPEAQYEIITESSGKAKVWYIPPDQIFEIGELRYPYR